MLIKIGNRLVNLSFVSWIEFMTGDNGSARGIMHLSTGDALELSVDDVLTLNATLSSMNAAALSAQMQQLSPLRRN